jgi:hypothetical protein
MRNGRLSLIGAAIALAVSAPVANATPSTEEPGAAQIENARKMWIHAVGVTPVGEHEKHILGAFVGADLDMDGMLSVDEYRNLVQQRADYMYERSAEFPGMEVGPRENLTAFAMTDLDNQFQQANRNKDDGLSFFEVYYYETFDRPGMFPPEAESVPQQVSGRWEQLTVKDHAPVYHEPPFSPEQHKKALEEGGFAAVDNNDDGVVSMFEASDFSLLTWTPAVHAFVKADANNDAVLTNDEFTTFQESVAGMNLQAERPGEFPTGKQ